MHQRYIVNPSRTSRTSGGTSDRIWHACEVPMVPVGQVGETERGSVERLLDADPYGAASRRTGRRARTRLVARRRPDLRVRHAPTRRVALLLDGHLTPVLATPPAVAAFAERVARRSAPARPSWIEPTPCSACGAGCPSTADPPARSAPTSRCWSRPPCWNGSRAPSVSGVRHVHNTPLRGRRAPTPSVHPSSSTNYALTTLD
jgi:hypothetical protein